MYSIQSRINFYDCDPAGILFYANIFKKAHKAYEEFLESLDLEIDFFDDDKYVLPIIHAEADYKNPLIAGGLITIEVLVTSLRESSFELTYFFVDENHSIKATAKTVHVSVDKSEFKKISLEKELSEKLALHK